MVQLVLSALLLSPAGQGRLEHNYFNRFEIWVTKHMIFYQLYSYDSPILGVADSTQLSPIICINIGTLLCFHVLLPEIESDLAKEHAPVGRALLTRKNVLVMATAARTVSEIQSSLVDLPRISFSLRVLRLYFRGNTFELLIIQRYSVLVCWLKYSLCVGVAPIVFPNENMAIIIDCHHVFSVFNVTYKDNLRSVTLEELSVDLPSICCTRATPSAVLWSTTGRLLLVSCGCF